MTAKGGRWQYFVFRFCSYTCTSFVPMTISVCFLLVHFQKTDRSFTHPSSKQAAAEKAEADKIVQVKAAEASAESKYLNGLGIARERKAIVDGLRGSVEEFSETVEGATPKDVMDLILLTQYFDMLKVRVWVGRGGVGWCVCLAVFWGSLFLFSCLCKRMSHLGICLLLPSSSCCSPFKQDVGNNPNATTLFMHHGPSAVTELKDQLKEGIMNKANAASS